MKILVGLGNPGFRYRKTRHNVGFDACRKYARLQGVRVRRKIHQCRCVNFESEGQQVVVALPQTYMNSSGEAAHELVEAFGPRREELLVVLDDFHLPLGSVRIRKRGTGGGHKGLESICSAIGEDFCRMRLGIGPKPQADEILKFVLGRWTKGEKPRVGSMLESAVAALGTFVRQGIELAMSRHNQRVEPVADAARSDS